MRLTAILIERQLEQSRQILKESCYGLDSKQRRVVEGIYNEFLPLIEVSLTADQITQIFGTVEKSATAAGGNRTMLGKAADVPGQVNNIINKAGKWLQDTTPVKMFDQKFEDLKGKVAAKFPELADKAAGLGEWVKANPGKSAAVIGILTTLAALAGGPVGGAIAGQVLRGAAELLKGEKLSTAVGKGIKTAALGYLSGKAFEILGNWVGGFRENAIPFGPKDAGLEKVNWGATRTLTAPGISSTETIQGFNITVFPEQREAVTQAMNAIRDGQAGGFDTLKTIAREINSPEYKSSISNIMKGAREIQLGNDSLLQWINGVSKAGQVLSQGAIAASDLKSSKKESYYVQDRSLSEGRVYLVFDRVIKLNEGPVWDKVKGVASNAVGAVAQKAGQIGTNLTTKVTADKLQSAWKKAGSPTDSDAVANILRQAGVDDAVISKVFGDMQIPITPAAAPPTSAQATQSTQKVNIDELVAKIKKLSPADQQRVITALGTA